MTHPTPAAAAKMRERHERLASYLSGDDPRERLRIAISARERSYALYRDACRATPFDLELMAIREVDYRENVRATEEAIAELMGAGAR